MNDFENIKKQIDKTNDFIWNLRTAPKEQDKVQEMLDFAFSKSVELGYEYGHARALLNQGLGAFLFLHDESLSDDLINQSRKIFEQLSNFKWIANADLTQAIIKTSTGKPDVALYIALKGMAFYENLQDDDDYRMACYVTGTVYKDLKKIDEAEIYYQKGIAIEGKHTSWSARLYAGLSNVKTEKNLFGEALPLAKTGLDLLQREENKIGISRSLNDIGNIYFKTNDFKQALTYFQESLQIRKELKHIHFILGSLLDVGKTLLAINELNQALEHFIEAEQLAIETKHEVRLTIIYQSIGNIYKRLKKFEEAAKYFEKLNEINLKLFNQERESKIAQSENKLLKDKEDEIERLRNVELKQAYYIIAEKNKEITDSIQYAERLQRSLMANRKMLSEKIPNHFIYFNPKEAVSGDFYWASELVNGNFALICADSTGHGVPGAIMSMMNMNSLKDSVKEELIHADEILNQTRKIIIQTLANDGSAEGGKDGMDAALLVFNQAMSQVEFALANNPLLLYRNGVMQEFKADKMPVGKHDQQNNPFTRHVLNLESGDMIYLFTDGYADQFGGENLPDGKAGGKKFKYSTLKELLVSIAHLSMLEQQQKLHEVHEAWRGSLEQVDDICIIGIRV